MDWVDVWVHSKWDFLCVRDWIEVWVHSSFFPEFGILENISTKRQKVSVLLMAGWKSVNFQMQSSLKGSVYFRETFRTGALVSFFNSDSCICLLNERFLEGSLFIPVLRLLLSIQSCLTLTVSCWEGSSFSHRSPVHKDLCLDPPSLDTDTESSLL